MPSGLSPTESRRLVTRPRYFWRSAFGLRPLILNSALSKYAIRYQPRAIMLLLRKFDFLDPWTSMNMLLDPSHFIQSRHSSP